MRYNIEHEKAVIARVKFNNAAYDDIKLNPDDFYDRRNARIFQMIGEIIESGLEANDLTIFDHLLKKKIDIDIAYISSLDPMSDGNIAYYVDSVRGLAKRRRLESMVAKIRDRLLDASAGTEEIIEEIEQETMRIAEPTVHKSQRIGNVLPSVLARIEKRFLDGGKYTGITTGLTRLDDLTGGFQDGELIIIGARTSVGKTAMALTMASNIAVRQGVPAGFFSCEMSMQTLMERMLVGEGKINLQDIRTGTMGQGDFDRILSACERMRDAPMEINDTSNIRLAELKSEARRMRRRGAKILFVDYLTIIRHEDPRMPRHERVGEVSKSLKLLARELDVPVVALSQINRDANDRMPSLANIRQSGEIEEDSDVVLFLHREDDGTETKLRVAKNRNGPTGTIDLVFLPTCVRFENRDYEEERKEGWYDR